MTVGDALDGDLTCVSRAVLGRRDYGDPEDLIAKVDQALERMAFLRSEIERLRGATIGEPFVVPIPADVLGPVMREVLVPAVEGFEGFSQQSPEDRERLLATRDAATRLCAELAVAGAVA